MAQDDSEGDSADQTQHSRYSVGRGVDDAEYARMDDLTRRRLLALGAGASLSALTAGCQGDDPGTDVTVATDGEQDGETDGANAGDTTVTEGPGGEVAIRTIVTWDWPAEETTMNYLSPSNFAGGYTSTFFHAPMTLYSKDDKEYHPIVLKELPTFQDCYQVHTFEEGWKWWDGTEVNALDHVWGHQVQAYGCCGGPDEVVWAAEPMESDYQFRENKGAPYAERYAAGNAQKGVRWKRDIWRPYIERLQDASTDEAVNEIIQEARELDLTVANVEEHNSGNGLWKPVSWSADRITMEKFEDHPWADRTDIDKWIIRVAPKKQTRLQLINNGQSDFGRTNYDDLLSDPPSELETVASLVGNGGKGLAFNWRRDHPGNRAFRRAIAYLLPLGRITDAARQAGLASESIDQQTTGAPTDLVSELTADGFLDSIIDYGVESDEQQALATLEEAGYSQQGGDLIGPDGQQVEVRLIGRSQTGNSNIGSAISGLLNDIGIETDFSVLESGTYDQTHSGEKGDFDYDITLTGMGIADSYATMVSDAGRVADVDATAGWSRPEPEECVSEPIEAPRSPNPDMLTQQEDGSGYLTWTYGIPVDEEGLFPEIPREVGQEDLSGETYRPPLASWALWTRFRFPEEKLREWTTQYLWWANFHVPKIYLFTRRANLWMDTQQFQMRDGGRFWSESEDKFPHVFGDVVTA